MFERHEATARLRRLRMTVRELARKAGLHYDAIHKLLAGRGDPRASTMAKVAAALEAEERGLRDYLNALHPPAPDSPPLPDPLAVTRRLEAAE